MSCDNPPLELCIISNTVFLCLKTHIGKTFVLHPLKWCGPLGQLIRSDRIRSRKDVILGLAIALFFLAAFILVLSIYFGYYGSGRENIDPTTEQVRTIIQASYNYEYF